MKTKNLVLIALFLGMGTVLNLVLPFFFAGMRPDILLTMMVLAIILFPEKKHVLLIGLATGLLSGIISTFPGGFVPNIIDKFITAYVTFALFLALRKVAKPVINAAVITALATVVSGTVFLGSALIIVSLPAPFAALFVTVVLPAIALNTILMVIIYPIVQSVLKRSNFEPLEKAV